MGQEQDYVGGRYSNGRQPSSDELKRQVDHTRAEMDETIDALIAKLDPAAMLGRFVRGAVGGNERTISQTAGQTVGNVAGKLSRRAGHTMADVGESLLVKAKENPIPTALIGLGIAYAMWSRNRDEEYYEFFDEYDDEGRVVRVRRPVGYTDEGPGLGTKMRHMGAAAGSTMGSTMGTVGSTMGKAGSGMKRAGSGVASAAQTAASATSYAAKSAASATGSAARSAASATSSAAHTAAEAAQSAGEATGAAASAIRSGVRQSASATREGLGVAAHTLSDVTHDAAEGLRHTGEQIRAGAIQGARVSRRTYKKAMRKSPLAVGGVALGLGILCGLIIPETRREDEMFGKTRDDLLDQGKSMANQAKDRVRHMAEATAATAMESLQGEGLTPGELAAAGQRIAESARKAAEEQLRKERATPRDLKEKLERAAEETAKTAEAEVMGETCEPGEQKSETLPPEGFA